MAWVLTMNRILLGSVVSVLTFALTLQSRCSGFDFSEAMQRNGVVAAYGLNALEVETFLSAAETGECLVYIQTPKREILKKCQQLTQESSRLKNRVTASLSTAQRIELADNVADWIFIGSSSDLGLSTKQILRPLRPGGIAMVREKRLTKEMPDGVDDWSHPYHGPDNNPQSNDLVAKGSFRTQFIGNPMFSPMPEQTVIANGKIFKAMGHLAHKENQNEMLNTLLCINAYNGVILWRRTLPKGFMIHRNTMIATDESLLLGDHESCKIIDAETGKIQREIRVTPDLSDGSVWKWMALSDGILYGLVGSTEVEVETQRSNRRGLGHWPWDMWQGHEYDRPEKSFGFGRTFVAIELDSGRNLWTHRTRDFIDARGVCMNDSEIFCYSPGRCLTSINRKTGLPEWRNESVELLSAIGANQKAQHYITGYATTCYLKCNSEHLFFAGPQREQTVVASTADGHVEWTYPMGNLQLVLRDDGVWAAGPQKSESGVKLDYETGKVLSTFPARRACTRATGCLDSIFFRANGGTVRVLTDNNSAQHFDPMRPPCQDGVLIAGGHLYWGPWMCGCQLSLYGNIALRPQKGSVYQSTNPARNVFSTGFNNASSVSAKKGDWTTYRGSNARDDRASISIPDEVKFAWQQQVSKHELATAATTANGMVFVADRSGRIQCFSREGKLLWAQSATGPIYYPPTFANGRVFVGCADGKVYAFSAGTGDLLWTFRIGPNSDRIPVFGSLISAWPVAGGVVVDNGTLYAAAGITHYDGTYIVALDAVTGDLKADNGKSGILQEEVNNGISLQGELKIVDGELRFLAGGIYETARYSLDTLQCLNSPQRQVDSQFRTAFYPYYPSYGKYISLDYQCNDGCELSHDASYEGSQFVNLARYPKRPVDAPEVKKEEARWIRRGGKMPTPTWQDQSNRRFTCFAATESVLMAGGHLEDDASSAFLAAIDTETGEDIWFAPLPCPPVKGGATLGYDGTIYVVLENGSLICLAPKNR